MYDRKDTLAKTLTVDKVQDIQGRLSPVQTTMRSVPAGTSTVLFVDILKYDEKIPRRSSPCGSWKPGGPDERP
ncbi:MAG: outer membrane lipoprotein-sorting protein [Candidatus Moduliflexus flocculans]|nr:outer membrane lipoprotein-sorting protein [Candidatus Moduliflexus flocculans]